LLKVLILLFLCFFKVGLNILYFCRKQGIYRAFSNTCSNSSKCTTLWNDLWGN